MTKPARVIDHEEEKQDRERKDSICLQYDSILEKLKASQQAEEFWRYALGQNADGTRDRTPLSDRIEDWKDQLAREREGWDHIKTKDFAESRAEVRARRILVESLENILDDIAAEVRAQKSIKATFEIGNEIILLGAGYKFSAEEARKLAEEAEPQAAAGDAEQANEGAQEENPEDSEG